MNTIKEGSKDTASVKQWQTLVGVKPDGIFGPNTTKATKAFQTAHGLKADGVVGPNTWAKAQTPAPKAAVVTKQVATANAATTATQTAQQQKAAVAKPAVPPPLPQPTAISNAQPTLREGSSDKISVTRWQNIINVKADGIFGPGTTAGTKVFQKAHGLKDDGVVGPNTWAAGLAVKAPTAKPVTPAATVQKKVEAVNAAATAANTIQAKKPQVVQPPPQNVKEVIEVTKKIVRENAKAVKNRAGAAKDVVTKHVQTAPTWMRYFAAGILGLGGLVAYKAINEPKRRSA